MSVDWAPSTPIKRDSSFPSRMHADRATFARSRLDSRWLNGFHAGLVSTMLQVRTDLATRVRQAQPAKFGLTGSSRVHGKMSQEPGYRPCVHTHPTTLVRHLLPWPLHPMCRRPKPLRRSAKCNVLQNHGQLAQNPLFKNGERMIILSNSTWGTPTGRSWMLK